MTETMQLSITVLYFRFLINRDLFFQRALQVIPGPRQRTFQIAGARFLQAGCPSSHQTNSVKAMKV